MEETAYIEEVEQQEPDQQPDPKPKKVKVKEFAAKIKAKYPDYKDVDDLELTNKIIAKYPEYKEQVDFTPEVKKKVGSINFEESSLQAGNAQSNGVGGEEIPTIEMYTTPQGEMIEANPFTLSKKFKELSTKTKEVEGLGDRGTMKVVDDEEARKSAAKLKEDFKDIDLDGISEETKDIPEEILQRVGNELLEDRKNNNPLYQRKIANIKWRYGLEQNIIEQVDKGNITPDDYNRIKNSIDKLPEFTGSGDFTNQRTAIQSLAKDIQNYGGENRDKILENFAVEVSKVYGNAYNNNFDKTITDTPESKYLNSDEQLALQYIKDVSPDKAGQYDRLMVDPKTLKDNPDALKGYNHLKQTLEETGISLQQNSVTEELNNLKSIATKYGGLTDEQLNKATELEKKQEELTQKRNELDEKYPDRIQNKVFDAVNEVMGSDLNWGEYAAVKTGQAFKNTGQGIWEAVSSPFMSDASNAMRELAIMGESLESEENLKQPDKNRALITDKFFIEPELQKQVDNIKNNNLLTDEQKRQKLHYLFTENTDKFGRVPIKGGKFNINPTSIVYGLTDLGATLVPFIALEAATGGGATAGAARKFISTFTAAAATSFHDEYASALLSGKSESEAYKEAMGMTAISSLAMAGASTPSKIKAMLNPKTSAGKLILSMSDDAIQKVLDKGTPKGLKAIKQSVVDRAKALPQQFKGGLKTGAEFEVAMNLANEAKSAIYDTEIDREQNFKQSLLGIANFGIMGAGLGQIGYKSPTELQKSALVKFGENPKEYISIAETLRKEGKLTPTEFDHRVKLIEGAESAFKKLPQNLNEKQKSDYLYQTVIRDEALKGKSDLPPKQAAAAEKTALVADHTRGLILEPPTEKQLNDRIGILERKLEPKKDAEGKAIEIPEKEKLDMQAELEALTNEAETRKSFEKVEMKRKDLVPPPTEQSGKENIEYDELPQNVKDIVDKYGDANDKTDFNKKLEEAGYTTEYDAESFGTESGVTFRKIEPQQSGKDGKVAPDAELGIQQGYAKKAMTDFINSPDMGYSIHEEGGKTALGLSEAQVRSANGLKGGDRMQSHEHTNIELTKDEKKQLNKIESDKELGDIDGLEYAKQKRALAKKIFERASNELQQKANEQSGKDVVVEEGVGNEWIDKNPNLAMNMEFLGKVNGERIGTALIKKEDGYYYHVGGKEVKIPNQARAEKAFNEFKQSEKEQFLAENKPEIKNEEAKAIEVPDGAKKEIPTAPKLSEDVSEAGGGKKEPPIEPTVEPEIFVEDKSTILSHRGLQEVATEFGLTDITSRETVSDLKEFKAAEETIDGWVEKGTYSKNIEKMIDDVVKGEALNFQQRVILQQHIANQRGKTAEIRKEKGIESKEYNDALQELDRLKTAGQIARSTAGAALRVGEIRSNSKPTLEDWMVEKQESTNVFELTSEQKKEVEKDFNEYEQRAAKAEEKLDQANAEISKLKAELALQTERGKRNTLRKRNSESLAQERKDIVKSIKEKWKGVDKDNTLSSDIPYRKQLAAIAPDVLKLTRNLLETGTNKLEDIVDNIFEELKGIVTNKKDIHDIIAGDYNKKMPPKTALELRYKELTTEAKLINELERLEAGGLPKDAKKAVQHNQRIKELREKISKFNPKREKTAEETLKTIKSRNEAEKKRIEEDIKNKNYTKEKRVPFDENAALKKANPKLWKEAMDAVVAKDEAKNKWELKKRIDELSKRSTARKTLDFFSRAIATTKAIKAGIDDSVTMVQLGMAVMANPKSGLNAKIKAIRDISNKTYKRNLAALHQSKYWNTIEKSGLDITEPKSHLKENVEELYDNNLLNQDIRINKNLSVNPWTNTGGIFERLFTSMGNNMRLNLFMKRIEALENEKKTFDTHPEEYKAAARIINELTGRGKVHSALEGNAMEAITPIIWAPKMLSSSLNLLGLGDAFNAATGKKGLYASLTPSQRKYALGQMGKGIGMGVSIMGTLAMNGWSVDSDPESDTFGFVKKGTKSYNVFGRYAGTVKTIVQLATGRKKTNDKVKDLDERDGRGVVFGKFFRGKMTPAAGLAYDLWLNGQKNSFTREPILFENVHNDLLTPISIADLKKGMEQDGTISLLTRFLPAFEGLQVRDDRDFIDQDIKLPEWKFLYENGLKLVRHKKETLKPLDENGNEVKVTDEKYKEFITEREKLVKDEVASVIKNGVVNWEDGTNAKFKDLTPEEKESWMMTTTTRATKEAREKIFGEQPTKEKKKWETAQ